MKRRGARRPQGSCCFSSSQVGRKPVTQAVLLSTDPGRIDFGKSTAGTGNGDCWTQHGDLKDRSCHIDLLCAATLSIAGLLQSI